MADKRIRRRFTPEFKAQAVKRVLDGRGLSEVATELGLSTGQLSSWRTEHLAAGSAEALAQRKAEEAEMGFPPGSGGTRSEHYAASPVIPSITIRASVGVL